MKLLNRKLLLFVFLVGILVTGSMSAHTVMADNHEETEESETEDTEETETDDDSDDDTEEIEDNEREVSIETSDTEVQIESENENENREDELKAEITTDSDAEIKVEYSSENETTESEAEMKVQFIELIEYNDTNSDGVYNESVDVEVNTYVMSEVGYKPIEYTTKDHTEGTEHIITLETTDGVFEVIVHIVGQITNINETDLKPTSLKIDIVIRDFDFKESNSKLALYSEVESTSEVEKEDDDVDDQIDSDEETFVQQGEGIFAFYSWKKTAQVDGQTTDVLASYEEKTTTEQKLYLNYEQGEDIVHDPKLGISIAAVALDGDSITDNITRLWPAISHATLFAISIVAATIVLAIPVLIKRKSHN